MSMDVSGLNRLSADLGRAPGAVLVAARGVVAKGALNIKNGTRKNISPHPSWRRLPSTVNFDLIGLTAVVGYDDRGQGELAGIYEFGSSRRGPNPTLYPEAERERPQFERAMLAAGIKSLGGLG
jgi:hypothetical protein